MLLLMYNLKLNEKEAESLNRPMKLANEQANTTNETKAVLKKKKVQETKILDWMASHVTFTKYSKKN